MSGVIINAKKYKCFSMPKSSTIIINREFKKRGENIPGYGEKCLTAGIVVTGKPEFFRDLNDEIYQELYDAVNSEKDERSIYIHFKDFEEAKMIFKMFPENYPYTVELFHNGYLVSKDNIKKKIQEGCLDTIKDVLQGKLP